MQRSDVTPVQSQPGTTNTYYAIRDHQNTVWGWVTANGAIVENYDFDAWGRVLSVKNGDGQVLFQSAIGNRYLFQGREYSWATGLYYFRARWYDPVTGRWLSPDPIGINGGLNQYVAFGNNPVNFVDPFGLKNYGVIVVGGGGGLGPIAGSGGLVLVIDFANGIVHHYGYVGVGVGLGIGGAGTMWPLGSRRIM